MRHTCHHEFPSHSWEPILFGIVELLNVSGIIPGAIAALGARRLYQKWRQNKAMAGWPATDAKIQSGRVHKEGMRYWVKLTYAYCVSEYRSGEHVHRYRREENADEFVRQIKDKQVQVHYTASHSDNSEILERDLEMVALRAPQYR